MNILFISENYPPYIEGGAEISTSLVARWLTQKHTVSVACSEFRNSPWVENDVTVYPILLRASVGTKSALASIRYAFDILLIPCISSIRVLRLLKKLKPDVVNIVITPFYFTPIILAIKFFTKIPLFIDCRDYSLICPAQFRDNEIDDPLQSHHGFKCLNKGYRTNNAFLQLFATPFALYESLVFNLYKSSLRYVINHSHDITLVPNSRYVQKQLILNGFHADKTVMINNISQSFDTTQSVVKASTPTFAYGGRIEKEKGIWDLIAAVEILKTEVKESFSIKIAGTGADFEKLSDYIKEKQLDCVTLLGRVEPSKVLTFYRESLAIIAPSRWPEPFGRFILEGISVGTPVIATAVGGATEGIEDGKTGFLIEMGNVEQMVAAMKYFITHPDQSVIMGKALTASRSKYDADFIGEKRIALYLSHVTHPSFKRS
ncbi:glycosyltransferase [Patescibacteria group bacterium]|nr:glycosyltransferase [Patescibacteria group bacterium]